MADSPAVGDIIKSITDDVKHLVRKEIELAKAELIPSAKKAGIGAGMFGGAGYFGINGLTLLYIAAALGIAALGVAHLAGLSIVAVALLLIAGILGLIGLRSVKQVKGPERTIAQANETVAEVKGAIQRANAAANAPQIEGRVVGDQSDPLKQRFRRRAIRARCRRLASVRREQRAGRSATSTAAGTASRRRHGSRAPIGRRRIRDRVPGDVTGGRREVGEHQQHRVVHRSGKA